MCIKHIYNLPKQSIGHYKGVLWFAGRALPHTEGATWYIFISLFLIGIRMQNNYLNKFHSLLFKNQTTMKKGFFQQWRVWLLCLGSLSAGTASAQGSRQSDSLELVALYNATNGANWTTQTNWLTNNPMNTWHGIGLSATGRVDSISLIMNRLRGSIPNLNLPNLKKLQLRDNYDLSGDVPNFNLPNLEILDLFSIRLGNIPTSNLPNLRTLIYGDMMFTPGRIPDFYLPNLQILNIWGATGNIPNFNLPNLRELRINNASSLDSIPSFNLPNLVKLEICCGISGTIPNFNLPNLQELRLVGGLSGCIPASIRTNCPRIVSSNVDISFNPNLSTQNWANYWNDGEGSCRTTVSGGTIVAAQCGNRDYRLPSGRIVNAIGAYADTTIHNTFAPDTAYIVNLIADTTSRCLDSIITITASQCGDRSYRLPSGRTVNAVGSYNDTLRSATQNTFYVVNLVVDTTCRCLDSIQLVSLYTAMNGAGRSNWFSTNPINTWGGISTTASGCVESINLSYSGLSGNIPNFSLPNLTALNLTGNNLSGSIPNFNLPNLQSLNLFYNRLSGSIPNFNLPRLSILKLTFNQLTGTIPNFNLPNLRQLDLSLNQLSGCIPSQIKTNCPIVAYGNISSNPNLSTQNWANYWNNGEGSCRITTSGGTINASLCANRNFQLPSGRVVNGVGIYADTIIHNTFTQDTAYTVQLIDDTSCRCLDSIQLVSLYTATNGTNWNNNTNWLSANPIQTWYGIRTTASGCVDSIGLNSDNLIGSLPNLNLPHLKRLFLYNNQLTGNIPHFRSTNLVSLQLSRNQFTGNIPNFNLPNLGYLQLSYNRLTGSIPNFDSTRLDWLSLGFNQLTGNIPNFNLAQLTALHLNNNQLAGALPPLSACPQLNEINISNNRFSFVGLSVLTARNLPSLIYAPQDSIGRDTSLTAYRANQVTLSIPMPHENGNKYSWYKGTAFITDTTATSQLPLFRLHPADAGTYYCKVTNPAAPNLTLWSRPIRVNVVTPAVVNGGTRTDLICGARDYQLPSGRIVNYAGTHQDTIVHLDATIDTAYTIQLRSDSSCHCQDSIALAGMYHASGGFPQNWDLNRPMSSWSGLTLDTLTYCVTSWIDARPDSIKCMALGGRDTLHPDFSIFTLVNGQKKWFKGNQYITDYNGNPLAVNNFQRADTGRLVCRIDMPAGTFALIPTLQTVATRAFQLKICCTNGIASTNRTILEGNCLRWGGINRCLTGVYRDTLFGGAASACDSIRILNLRVVRCNADVNITKWGNTLYANATSTFPPMQYQWSNGVQTSNITVLTSGNYAVTVTDSLGCKDTASFEFHLDRTQHFRMGSSQVSCTDSSNCTPIFLTQPLQNAVGYILYADIDATLIRPNFGHHRYKYRMPDAVNNYLWDTIRNGNQLVIEFGVTGLANMSGRVNDTLICLSWLPATTNITADTVTPVRALLRESIRGQGGYTDYQVNNDIEVTVNTRLLTWVHPLGYSTANNLTRVKSGVPRQMNLVGQVSSAGIFEFNPLVGTHIGYFRNSVSDRGAPYIGASDVRLLRLLVAGIYNAEVANLTAQQIMAADTDGDGLLTVADITYLENRAVFRTTGFEQAANSLHAGLIKSWVYVPRNRLLNDPIYQLNYMRTNQGYRVPKTDTIFEVGNGYRSCSGTTMDVDGILLGDINKDNTDMSKGKLSANDSVIIMKCGNEIIRSFPVMIKSDTTVTSIDATFDNFDPMMEILSIDSIRPELEVRSNINNTDKYATIITYARNLGAISKATPIFYLRVKYKSDPFWSREKFGTMSWYFNSKKVGSRAESSCTSNGEIITRPIHIYPNPSAGLFTIESSEKLGTVRVYDAIGRLVKTMETIDNQANIDLSDYANGLYMVRIGQQSYKIMKH